MSIFKKLTCFGSKQNFIPIFQRYLCLQSIKYQSKSGCGNNQQQAKQGVGRGLPERKPIKGVKHVVLVGSAKGGVGKSTVSLNTALAIKSLMPQSNIGLLDVDVFGPSLPTLMDLHGKPHLTRDNMMIPLEKHDLSCMSMGFLIPEGAPIVWRGMMLMQGVQQLLKKVQWNDIEVLVVDLPPGTGDVPLSVIQNVPVDGSVMVTTPHKLSLVDVHRGVNMFRKLDVPIFGVVENMSYHVCGNCGHQSRVLGGGASKTHEFLERVATEKIGEIPMSEEMVASTNDGVPLMVAHPQSASAEAFTKLAENVLEKLQMKRVEAES